MTKKPLIYSIGCSILMSPLFSSPSGTFAALQENAVVTVDALNVRSYPSTGSSIIGKLTKHTEVTILEEQNGWAKITHANKEGWVSSAYIQKGKQAPVSPAAPALSQGAEAFVKATSLNVRSAPDTSGSILASLPNNTKVTVLTAKGDWTQIKTTANQIGWVASQYLTKTGSTGSKPDHTAKPTPPVPAVSSKTGTVNASRLNVRAAADLNGAIVTSLPKNAKVAVLAVQGSWVHIKLDNGKTGWVSSSYLTISETVNAPAKPVEIPAGPTPESTKTGTVNVSSLNLRSVPSTSGQVLASLPRNTVVTVLQVQTGWAQVKTAANQTGWVASPYVTMKDENKTPAAPAQSVTLQSNANLRKGPGTNFAIAGSGQAGSTYTLIKEQNEWMQIKLANGQEAWIAGWLVTKGSTVPSAPAAPPASPSSVLKGKRIVIDAGHGGKDSGTVGQKGSFEKTLALNTSKLVASLLESAGANVVMTRDDDTFISLSGRVKVSHQHNADAFISIHYNAASPSANGIMSFYYSAEKERQLAKAIQESLLQHTNRKDMGVRFGNFHVIRENKKPAVLLELGFLSNAAEEQHVKSDAFQQSAAKAIYEGIARYFEEL
jgi:N-acetylmuramoyl-L-alanine amidase